MIQVFYCRTDGQTTVIHRIQECNTEWDSWWQQLFFFFIVWHASNKPDEANTTVSSSWHISFHYLDFHFPSLFLFPVSFSFHRSLNFIIAQRESSKFPRRWRLNVVADCAVSGESPKKPQVNRESNTTEDSRAINRHVVYAETRTITGSPVDGKKRKVTGVLTILVSPNTRYFCGVTGAAWEIGRG